MSFIKWEIGMIYIFRTKEGDIKLATNTEMKNGTYEWISFNDEKLKNVTHFIIPETIEI